MHAISSLNRLARQSTINMNWSLQAIQMFQKKTGPFVISSYLCSNSYELQENFQKYIGGVVCCEYGINVCDSLTILCQYHYN